MFIPPSHLRRGAGGRRGREARKAIAIPAALTAVVGAITASLTSSSRHGGDTAGLVVFCVMAAGLAVALGWAVARLVGRGGKI